MPGERPLTRRVAARMFAGPCGSWGTLAMSANTVPLNEAVIVRALPTPPQAHELR